MPNNLNVTTLDDVLASVQGTANPKTGFILQEPIQLDKRVAFEGVTYDIPKNAIYDRLSDGSYTPRVENYIGAVGNEDRLAKQQSGWEQAVNGLTKAVVKTGAYALDATVGTVAGIINGINEESWDGVWNNEISQGIDDFNKKLDNNLVNYYTDEEKARGLLAAIPGFGGATNFWFNDVAGGMAFVAGVIVPEIAIGVLSGGATVGTSMAKIGLKYGAKSVLKEGAESAFKSTLKSVSGYNKYKEGASVLRGYQRAVYGKIGGDIAGTGMFLARTSNFEAGMEARHNFNTAIESFYTEYEALNGRPPSYDETTSFIKDAKSAANGVYAANLAILSVSNAVMFSSKFNIGVEANKSWTNALNKNIGLGVKHNPGFKSIMYASTRGERVLGNTYKILGKPAVEGLYEEGLQGVAGTTMQNYLQAKYDPKVESGYDFFASLTDAFAHQYGTAEGWKEIGIGMIIGSMGGTMQKGAPNFVGFGKDSRKSRQAQIEGQLDIMNQGQDNLTKRLNQATAMSNYGNISKSTDGKGYSPSIDRALTNRDYIQSQEVIKSKDEILADYDAVVDNMQLTDAQKESIGTVSEDGLTNPEIAYKDALKTEFRKDLKNYTFAKRAVVALGLDDKDRGGSKETKGNNWEVQDAMIRNIMVGKGALEGAETIASQIEAMTGLDGVFSALEHYGSLSQEKRKVIKKIKGKKGRLEMLKKEHMNFANKIAGLPSKGQGRFSEETKQARYKEASEKAFATQLKINELEQEIETLSEALNSDLRAENFNIDRVTSTEGTPQDIVKSIEELDKLETFMVSLDKSGRGQDAAQLEAMIEEYKMHSDAHREMNNTYRRMLDTDFFNSKEGKGLKNMIIGRKYKMSEEFKKIIQENDAIIDASLKQVGYRGAERVEEILKSRLEDNEELSEREKYRLESIIRLQLGYQKVGERIAKAEEEASEEIVRSGESRARGPLDGDTIQLKTELNSAGQDLGNVKVLDKLINQITDELDQFRIGKVNNARLTATEAELNKLKGKREKVNKEAIVNQIDGFEKDLIAAKEFGTEEEVATIEQQIEDMKSKLPDGLDSKIKDLEKELEDIKSSKIVKIVKSPEYRRLYELNSKKANKDITEEELEELSELEESVDQWMMITGIVTEGLRLSDLIQQKAVLETTAIAEVEVVKAPTSQEVMESSNIPDKGDAVNYDFGQTYDGVTVIRNNKGEIEIAGITWDQFAEKSGLSLDRIETKKEKGKIVPIAPFTTNKQGNILLTDDIVDEINAIGNLSILATNKSLNTNYSMVLETTRKANGATDTLVLRTNYSFSDDMIPDAIYKMKPGDEVQLEVSPTDPYNKDMIDRYNATKSEKVKESIKKEMRDGLVIRVLRKSGDKEFVAVFKGKRDNGMKNKEVSDKFEALRDQIINDDTFFEPLVSTEVNRLLNFDGITVKTVFIGHPNFYFTKNQDGTVAIESRELTNVDIEKIEDTGYLDKDGTHTMSGKEGVDTRFIQKAARENPDAKIPFIVISKENQRIAFPVRIQANSKESLEEFSNIYDSKISPADKASALNIFMAKKGIDIKTPGNSFIGVGATNINDEFFSEKLAQLKSINYFRDLKTWADPSSSKEQVLRQGVSTNINLNDPIHSPKLRLDFKGLDVEVSSENIPSTVEVNKKTSTDALDIFDERLKNAKEKDC